MSNPDPSTPRIANTPARCSMAPTAPLAGAMLHAVGFNREDFRKSQVGIASTWSMVTPCNMHIDKLALEVVKGVDAAGGKGVPFGTITISDGISMGTEGMKYSLVSREVIADSIETVVGCEGIDGIIAIGGCDKNMPGCVMALARLNRPGLFIYGGTIKPGCYKGKDVDVVSVLRGDRPTFRRQDHRRGTRRHHRSGHPWARFLRRDVHGQHHGFRDRSARNGSPNSSAQAAVSA